MARRTRRCGTGWRSSSRVGLPPRPRPRRRTRRRPGEGRAPRATVPGSAPPNPWSVGARREIMPNYGPGRRRAGRVGLLSNRSLTAEQRAADSGPSTSEASGRPSLVRPDPLLTVGTFEGIFRPLEIGRHLGSRLSSPGVSELLSGPDRERRRRGTSVRFHAPRQQSPAPSRPETERREPRDPCAAAAPPPRPRM